MDISMLQITRECVVMVGLCMIQEWNKDSMSFTLLVDICEWLITLVVFCLIKTKKIPLFLYCKSARRAILQHVCAQIYWLDWSNMFLFDANLSAKCVIKILNIMIAESYCAAYKYLCSLLVKKLAVSFSVLDIVDLYLNESRRMIVSFSVSHR